MDTVKLKDKVANFVARGRIGYIYLMSDPQTAWTVPSELMDSARNIQGKHVELTVEPRSRLIISLLEVSAIQEIAEPAVPPTAPQPQPQVAEPALSPQPEIRVVDPDTVISPSFSIRTVPEDPDLGELTESIKQVGILEPVIARPTSHGIERVTGGRRQRAAKAAGSALPVLVREMTDAEAFEAQLVENLHRRELTDYEKGRAFREAMIRFKDRYPTQETLAKRVGKSQEWVSRQITAYETAELLKKDAFMTRVIKSPEIERMPEFQLRELQKAPPEVRPRILEELREEEARKPRVIEAPPLAPARVEEVPAGVSARRIAAKAKEIKYTHDVAAYLEQLKSNATRHFSEIASILEDLDSHAKKGLASESQLDDAYEHVVSLLKAAVKNLPKKYRSQVLG